MGIERIMTDIHWDPFALFRKRSSKNIQVYLGEKEDISGYKIRSFIRDDITIRQMLCDSNVTGGENNTSVEHRRIPKVRRRKSRQT